MASKASLTRIYFEGDAGTASDSETVVDAQLHPTRPWTLVANSSGLVTTFATGCSEPLHRFEVDQTKYGVLRSARFFDADTLVHVSQLPPALVAETRSSLIVVVCAKGILVYDCVTRICTPHAPPVLAHGAGNSKSMNGALSGAALGISCEHIVVGTTFGSLFTVNVRTGVVSAFSGTTKLHEKSIVQVVAVTGRPSPQLHRARIVTGCTGGIVAVWEIPCETPIYKSGPRVLVQNATSPVLDLRFDPSRNRLACCFGNGSAMVWAFDEHSQEEIVVASISKGFTGGQIAIPRGSRDLHEDSLLMITAGKGALVGVLPSAAAVRGARHLVKGVTGVANWESKSSSSISGTSETVVAIRTIISLADSKAKTDSTENGEDSSKRILKFWHHALDHSLFLILAQENNSSRVRLYLLNRNASQPAMHHNLSDAGKPLVVVDNRLVFKMGSRFQSEKMIAHLNPYSPGSVPQSIKDWAVPGDLPAELLASLDPDRPIELLWPGSVSCVSCQHGNTLLLGFSWSTAGRFIIASYKLPLGAGTTVPDSPQTDFSVIHYGSGDCVAFSRGENGDRIVLVGRQETITPGADTAITQSRASPGKLGMMSLPSFKSNRALKSTSGSFKVKQLDSEKSVQHFYLAAYRINASVNSPVSTIAEILVNQPVIDIIGDLGGDIFLMRCDPPAQLHRTLRPWSRFMSLKAFVEKKTLVHVGPQIPAHRLVSKWEHQVGDKLVVSLAVSFEQIMDKVAILDVVGSEVRFRGSVFTQSVSPCVSLKWHLGSLFIATNENVLVTFPGGSVERRQDQYSLYVLAGRGRSAHSGAFTKTERGQRRDSLHVHDDTTRPEDSAFGPSPSFVRPWEESDGEESAKFPIPVLRPFLQEMVILGVDKDSAELLTLSPSGKISLIPLKHPLLRVGMLAAAGLSNSALKWTRALSNSVEVRDEAVMLLTRLSFPKEAVQVSKATPELLLDVCIKFHCIEQAILVFHARSKAFAGLGAQLSDSGLSNYQRLALLLLSGGHREVVLALLPSMKMARDREFCSALVSATATATSGKPTISS